MNKIYTLLLMALALSLLVFWTSKKKREKEPFCIIYHVAVHTLSARKLIITYTNTNGLVQETFTGKKWEKKVCLSPDEIASLRIDEITDPGKEYQSCLPEQEELQDPMARDFAIKPLSIWIEHEKKTVLNAGYNHLQISLLTSEIDR